ncbi:hypothetical protein ACUNWD_20495 [Sunxiuqinia sp. A32]|uniref:hypothetical protein n=1 Tax=Sunxiuqinia sp. A32 TaxID=3461496 RepID=UPI0040464B55
MKKLYLIISLIFISSGLFAQYWSAGARLGVGSYEMKTLKTLQQYRLEQVTIPLKTTEEFPMTLNYRAELALNDWSIFNKLGIFGAFNSTGARSTVSDYSGRIDLDAIINGTQLGLTLQKHIQETGELATGFYVDASWMFTTLKMKDYLDIEIYPAGREDENYQFKASGFALEPGFYMQYRLNNVRLQANIGYMIDFSRKLFVDGNKDQWLEINRQVIYPGWSGIRLGLQLEYCLSKKANDNPSSHN